MAVCCPLIANNVSRCLLVYIPSDSCRRISWTFTLRRGQMQNAEPILEFGFLAKNCSVSANDRGGIGYAAFLLPKINHHEQPYSSTTTNTTCVFLKNKTPAHSSNPLYIWSVLRFWPARWKQTIGTKKVQQYRSTKTA